MKASQLIGELVRAIAVDGDRDVHMSIRDAGATFPVESVRAVGFTIFLRDPEPEVDGDRG